MYWKTMNITDEKVRDSIPKRSFQRALDDFAYLYTL